MSSDSLPDRALQLLKEADGLIHKANSAARKLNVEMRLRYSMPSWAEFDWLIDQRDAMLDWQKRARAMIAGSVVSNDADGSTETSPITEDELKAAYERGRKAGITQVYDAMKEGGAKP